MVIQTMRWRGLEYVRREERLRTISLDEECGTDENGYDYTNLDRLDAEITAAAACDGAITLREAARKKELLDTIRWDILTPMQKKIVLLRARGVCYEGIAKQLSTTKRSATVMTSNALRKLNYAVTHPPERGLEGKRRGGKRGGRIVSCLRTRIRKGLDCVCGSHVEVKP